MSIIFVHGSGAYGDIWRYQTDYFSGSHAVNLPGHPHGQPLKSVEECVEWLKKYVDGRGYKDVVLAGHSFLDTLMVNHLRAWRNVLSGSRNTSTGGDIKM